MSLGTSLGWWPLEKVAKRIASSLLRGRMQRARMAKNLGAPAAGGKRRSTKIAYTRLQGVKKNIKVHHSLRKMGVDVKTTVRAAMIPKMTYAIEVMGHPIPCSRGREGQRQQGQHQRQRGNVLKQF